jgi:WD40 repeat protein
LIQIFVNKKIKKFENVKGSTIDSLLSPDFTDDINGIQEIIHTQAYESFLTKTGINNPIVDMPCTEYTDIQFTILSGHTNTVKSSSLIMSLDSNYLKSQDIDEQAIIWNINKGEKIELRDDRTIWANGEVPACMSGALDKEWQFFAISTDDNIRSIHELSTKFKLHLQKHSIFLVKKIQQEGYLCRLALHNNFYNKDDLTALINSKSFNMINGFPQQNLFNKINKQLTTLSSTK